MSGIPDGRAVHADVTPLHVHVMSAAEMMALGRTFSSLYLKPLLNSEHEECRGMVVAAYGSFWSGKTTFIHGCSEELLPDVTSWKLARAVNGPVKVGPHRIINKIIYCLNIRDH